MTDENVEYDDDTPVEETPGYVGCIFDNEISFNKPLMPLDGFDFSYYQEMGEYLGSRARNLIVDIPDQQVEILADAWSLEEILEFLPAVTALYFSPPDQGPAGGSGSIFVVSDGWTKEDVRVQATALRLALDRDFKVVEVEYG